MHHSSHDLAGASPDHHIANRVDLKKLDHADTKTLLQTPVQNLLPENHPTIVTVKKTDHINSALKVLIDKGILSCPVYDVKEHKYIGFIDMVDMVTHILTVFKESELMGGELPHLLESKERFTNHTCGSISDISRRNPWKPVEKKMTLSAAIDSLLRWKVHRIPVVDSDGEMITLITESQICSFLHSKIDEIGPLAKKKLEELKIGFGQVYSVGLNARAVDAFKLMHEHGISAVAVVNSTGELVGNISVSDLKLIGADAKWIGRLFLSVDEFLKLIPSNNVFGAGPICVVSSTTYEEVLAKIVMAKIHRVYVVDQATKKPIGIWSQHEVLQAVSTHH